LGLDEFVDPSGASGIFGGVDVLAPVKVPGRAGCELEDVGAGGLGHGREGRIAGEDDEVVQRRARIGRGPAKVRQTVLFGDVQEPALGLGFNPVRVSGAQLPSECYTGICAAGCKLTERPALNEINGADIGWALQRERVVSSLTRWATFRLVRRFDGLPDCARMATDRDDCHNAA
jgi:hypothetical protein